MCKYCGGEISSIPMNHNLRTVKDDKGNYVKADLISNCNKSDFKSSIRFESCASDKISRITIYVDYCPICGTRLKNRDE